MEKIKSKKQVIITMTVALLLFLGSFPLVLFCDKMEKQGSGNIPWIWIGIIGFFACDIVSIVLIFRIYGDAIYHDMVDKNQKYSAVPLSEIKDMSKHRVHKTLAAHRFKELPNGYFRKKIFSFAKDSICYYVKCVDIDFVSGDIAETADREFGQFDRIDDENKCVCLLLLLYKEHVAPDDMEAVKELSKSLAVLETVMPKRIYKTSVVVLVDTITNKGWFLDVHSKLSITVYAYGCRLLKKYFTS